MEKVRAATQTERRREWKKVKASIISRFMHAITFGFFGRVEWIDFREYEVVIFIAGEDERMRDGHGLYRPFLSSGYFPHMAKNYNCRCLLHENKRKKQ